MSLVQALDLSAVVLNGVTITGWSQDEDALTLPDASELYKIERGADGKMIGGRTGEDGGQVTLKLLANSPSVAVLQGFRLAEENGAVVAWNGIIKYNNGSINTLLNGLMTTAPKGNTLGKGVPKVMSYIFEFESIIFETITGDF